MGVVEDLEIQRRSLAMLRPDAPSGLSREDAMDLIERLQDALQRIAELERASQGASVRGHPAGGRCSTRGIRSPCQLVSSDTAVEGSSLDLMNDPAMLAAASHLSELRGGPHLAVLDTSCVRTGLQNQLNNGLPPRSLQISTCGFRL